jgi:hypothetical protein
MDEARFIHTKEYRRSAELLARASIGVDQAIVLSLAGR